MSAGVRAGLLSRCYPSVPAEALWAVRLENRYRGNPIVGSNPTLSANFEYECAPSTVALGNSDTDKARLPDGSADGNGTRGGAESSIQSGFTVHS